MWYLPNQFELGYRVYTLSSLLRVPERGALTGRGKKGCCLVSVCGAARARIPELLFRCDSPCKINSHFRLSSLFEGCCFLCMVSRAPISTSFSHQYGRKCEPAVFCRRCSKLASYLHPVSLAALNLQHQQSLSSLFSYLPSYRIFPTDTLRAPPSSHVIMKTTTRLGIVLCISIAFFAAEIASKSFD